MPADPSSGPAGKTPKTPARSAGSHQRGAAALPARAVATSAVEVRRSTRRRKSVTAYREGDRTIVLIPARMSQAEERRWVGVMLDKLAAQESKRHLGDTELEERSARLSAQYFDGRARPASVRWVTNQNTRWGSCTPRRGQYQALAPTAGHAGVRRRLRAPPRAGASARSRTRSDFWQLLEAYPRTERARGFLEGVVAAEGLPRLPAAREE